MVVSTTLNCGRYPVKTFVLDETDKDIGRKNYKTNLITLKKCLDENSFPALQKLLLPSWVMELRNDLTK